MTRTALTAALLALGPAWGQGLAPVEFPRDVPVSLAESEPWSWFGLPTGPVEACGATAELPAAADRVAWAAAGPIELPAPAAVVYVLLSPVVESHLASVDLRSGAESVTVPAEDCGLVWAAPPPHCRRLLLARAEAPEGAAIERIVPRGCYVFAVLAGDQSVADDAALRDAYAAGQEAWRPRFWAEAPAAFRLRPVVETIPAGRIAVMPPRGAEPAALTRVLSRTGLARKLVLLQADDLLDPAVLSPQRFPVVLYEGFEQHLRSIHAPNDAAEAVVRYLAEGGAIVMATSMPYPTYYAVDAGQPAPIPNEPLLRRLGIECVVGFERPPEGAPLTIRPVEGQTVFPSLPAGWSYPTSGDLRLRCFGVPTGDVPRTTPLIEVVDADGARVGVCASTFDWPPASGAATHTGGTILYVWSGVMNDARVAEGVACDLLRWIAARATGGGG